MATASENTDNAESTSDDGQAKKTAAKRSTSKKAAAKKSTSKKSAPAKKTAAKKSTSKKPAAKKSAGEGREATEGRSTRRAKPRAEKPPATKVPAMKVARSAAQQLVALTGRQAESVIGIERTEDGWLVDLEVVESRRIPDSTDVLATYQVQTDEDGDLTGYHRVRRYIRGKGGDGEGYGR